jgi:hypothetical protein
MLNIFYDIILIPILLFINFIFEIIFNKNLNIKLLIPNFFGGIFGIGLNLLLITSLNLQKYTYLTTISKYFNFFIFQQLFYIIIYNDFSLFTFYNILKIIHYIFAYLIIDKYADKVISDKNKYKDFIISIIKNIGAIIIIEILFKNKLDEIDNFTIIKLFFIYIIFYFLLQKNIDYFLNNSFLNI